MRTNAYTWQIPRKAYLYCLVLVYFILDNAVLQDLLWIYQFFARKFKRFPEKASKRPITVGLKMIIHKDMMIRDLRDIRNI
ncbi:Uncharacterised protein [uncultured archaeon]|nr:Uncharacterised protein [uncultured archaeon]